jgi:hypothetical protein
MTRLHPGTPSVYSAVFVREDIRTGAKRLMGRLRCFAWWLLFLVGCHRSDNPLAPVQGQVFYRGQPLAGGTIVFTPDPERGGRGPQAWAEIKAEGRFDLSTDGKRGAVPGWHRITIAASKANRTGRLPARYRDPELSGQRFEVKPDQGNVCTLHLAQDR